MAATFESLLAGRKLHELTDEEIDELISQLQPEELEKLHAEIRKQQRKPAPTRQSQAAKKAREDFAKQLILGGSK